jgi:hypothetical protein
VVEVVQMVSDDLVEGESGGARLRLDDRRRSVFAGEVAVDGFCLEAIGKLCEELFRPLGVGVVATERRLSRDSVLDSVTLYYSSVITYKRATPICSRAPAEAGTTFAAIPRPSLRT